MMKTFKKLFFAAILICMVGSVNAQTVMVPVQILTELSSGGSTTGSSMAQAIVANDVMYNGEIVIKQGTIVNTAVQTVQRKGLGKPGKVIVKVLSTSDVKGNVIPLSGCDMEQEGKNKLGAAIGLGVGLGLFVIPPFGLFFLCKKGGDATIPAGTVVTCVGQITL